MKLFLLIFCLITSFYVQSQTWFVANPKWTYFYETYFYTGNESNEISGDTILDGFNAKIITRKLQLDEDPVIEIVDKKIVRENGDSAWVWVTYAHKFILEYNLTLTVGDTFFLDPDASNHYTHYIVDSLGFTEINGQSLWTQFVTFNWENSSNYCHIRIVERIGMIDDLCFSHFFLDEPDLTYIDGPGRKFCSYQDDEVSLSNNQVFCPNFVNIPTLNTDEKVILYPNPTSDFINFKIFDEDFQNNLQILDMHSQIIKNINIESNASINISDLNSGIYIVKFIINNQTYFKKFIKL